MDLIYTLQHKARENEPISNKSILQQQTGRVCNQRTL